jgi:tRNA(adenine34) deaminase
LTPTTDNEWMQLALANAKKAYQANEVPVGAVIVDANNNILGQGWNQPVGASDPSAHAEIVALRLAANSINNYRIPDATLYVTLEPCAMCAGAMVHARIKRLVFGAKDPRTGAAGSVFNLTDSEKLNHRIKVTSGILADECGNLLKEFFQARRK